VALSLSALAARYALAAGGDDPGFVLEIDPADEMYSYGLHSLRGSHDAAALLYFSTGRLIADSVAGAIAWRFGGRPGLPASILDFAAGYGRVTRFLARRFPSAEITAAEVDPAAARFQERALGVEGLVSPREAADFAPGRAFDAVLAVSLFSHLPAARFGAWLARLWSCAAPGGILIFSTHGPALHGGEADWSKGIVFTGSSETQRLDPAEYGTTWVTEAFVAEAVRAGCPGGALTSLPFGLDGRQDLYAVARPPGVPAARPEIPGVPRGDLDRVDLYPDRLVCSGGLDSVDEARVAFLVRDEERAAIDLPPGAARRPWRFEVSLDDVAPDDVLRVEARSPSGPVRILTMGTLRPYV
jgi:SAM-dependent methyltransferase